MSAVDDHLATCRPAERALLEHYRELARGRLEAKGCEVREVVSYRMPALAVGDGAKQVVCSFLQNARFCSWYPFSGSIITALADDLAGFETTKGSIHFSVDHPLPDDLVIKLVDTRLAEIEPDRRVWKVASHSYACTDALGSAS